MGHGNIYDGNIGNIYDGHVTIGNLNSLCPSPTTTHRQHQKDHQPQKSKVNSSISIYVWSYVTLFPPSRCPDVKKSEIHFVCSESTQNHKEVTLMGHGNIYGGHGNIGNIHGGHGNIGNIYDGHGNIGNIGKPALRRRDHKPAVFSFSAVFFCRYTTNRR